MGGGGGGQEEGGAGGMRTMPSIEVPYHILASHCNSANVSSIDRWCDFKGPSDRRWGREREWREEWAERSKVGMLAAPDVWRAPPHASAGQYRKYIAEYDITATRPRASRQG